MIKIVNEYTRLLTTLYIELQCIIYNLWKNKQKLNNIFNCKLYIYSR